MARSYKKAAAAVAGLALWCAALPSAQAQAPSATLDKIKASGKVVLGVRESSPPMAYALGANEKYVGYHVELCERVLKEIVPTAKLEYMAITAQSTMPLVSNGTVDIGCGPTTNNLARQQQVAFAVTSYVSEVRMAVRKDSDLKSISQLGGRTVAASTGTTAVQLLRKQERVVGAPIKTVLGKDHHESFMLLESGRVDAFVLDDNILAGVIANSKDPSAYRIVGEPLGRAHRPAVSQGRPGLQGSGRWRAHAPDAVGRGREDLHQVVRRPHPAQERKPEPAPGQHAAPAVCPSQRQAAGVLPAIRARHDRNA